MATFTPTIRDDLAVVIPIPEGATGEDIVRAVAERLERVEAPVEHTLDINEITRDAGGNVIDHKGNRVEK